MVARASGWFGLERQGLQELAHGLAVLTFGCDATAACQGQGGFGVGGVFGRNLRAPRAVAIAIEQLLDVVVHLACA